MGGRRRLGGRARALRLLVLAAAVVLMHAGPAAACADSASAETTAAAHGTHQAGDTHHGCPDGSATSHHHCQAGAVQTGPDLDCPAAAGRSGLDPADDASLAATPATHHRAHGPPRPLDPVLDLCVHRV